MTLEEARQKAIAAGITVESDLTPQVLKQFGWTPSDPFAGITLQPTIVTEADAKDHLALLIEDGKNKGIDPSYIAMVVGFGKMLIPLI